MRRVPLVILTGFLGAGKTTLVNRILGRRAERGAGRDGSGKLGVIVNELGQVGIDGALLGGREGELARQIELPGGCVCCILGDDLERTLVELVDANTGPGDARLAAIVLETTGVAEPLPIAWAAQRAPADLRVRLAAVVTLADATHFRAARKVSPAVDAQVAYADVVLITKAEIAGEQETAAVLAEIRTLAPRALVWIRGIDEHAAWLEGVLADPEISRPPDAGPPPTGRDHRHVHAAGHAAGHAEGDPDHECRHAEQVAEPSAHGIDSVWVSVRGVVDLEELEDQLAALPANYVRIKGIVRAVDGRVDPDAPARWIAVHRVGLRVSSEPLDVPADAAAVPDLQEPCIVALGPAVRVGALTACVDAALA
ncbi:MAG TPA: CobW family GTP-binding protein [Kofleriaceae bacterium]|nr:CobW family GTP-binding protein [Kofleriaceae bacterium]